MRKWKFIQKKTKRRNQAPRAVAFSTFSVFLLGFGLVYWIFHMVTVVFGTDCEYAYFWTFKWDEYQSAFQLIGAGIILASFIWLVRLISVSEKNAVETGVQLLFIAGLAASFIAQKTFLFPYTTPTRDQVDQVRVWIYGEPISLLEETHVLRDLYSDWEFDYPPPPFSNRPEPPWWSQDDKIRVGDIFTSENSPYWGERKAAKTCIVHEREAIRQFENDLELWDTYWEGFEDWYEANAWRYRETPRPFYW